jgi:hypothetical protein
MAAVPPEGTRTVAAREPPRVPSACRASCGPTRSPGAPSLRADATADAPTLVDLLPIHTDFAWVVVYANAAAGMWALGAHLWAPLRHPTLWWFTIAAEITIFLEVALGVALVVFDDFELEQFRAFYGFVAAVTVGLIYSYKAQIDPWRYLLYGLGGLFLMGLALRAIQLA